MGEVPQIITDFYMGEPAAAKGKDTFGNYFKDDALFCRKCGTERPSNSTTGIVCECGNMFADDAMFCRKCGAKRPNEKAITNHTKCACGNLFAEDSTFCRKCGTARPGPGKVTSRSITE